MLVSIITPSFNSEQFILDTYHSILKQTYSDWEWIVTDDCSFDNTYSILDELSKVDHRIRLFKNQINSGAAKSRNNSLYHARGDFIAFLDADDIWLPDKLEKQIQFMGDNIDFSFTSYELINEQGESLNKFVDVNSVKMVSYSDMLQKLATLGCSTVLLRKSSYTSIKMPDIRTGQDYALWLNLLKNGNNAYLLQEVLTQYRIVPGSISRNKFKKAKRQWQIYRELEKLSLSFSIKCFFYYAVRAVFRR